VTRLFMSHAGADTKTAIRVKEWLAADGHQVFIDREGLLVGEPWRERLYGEIRRADAMVCLVTPAFNTSQWCAAEVGIAQSLGKTILPVRAARDVDHGLISGDIHYADLTGGSDRARAELLRAARHLDGIHHLRPSRLSWTGRRSRNRTDNVAAGT
jgi:hypothetical protein